jgi:hypothetical protein
VVPRAWTIYFAEMSERDLPDELPEAWRAVAREESGAEVPGSLSEESPPGGDPAEVEAALQQVRRTLLGDAAPS